MKLHDEPDKGSFAGARAPSRISGMVTVFIAGLCLAFGIADADVPTGADIAACNQEAGEGFRDRSISPTSSDEAGADAARQADGAGAVTQSPDPQINGIDSEGAKDAAYRAAYRVCMRRSGF